MINYNFVDLFCGAGGLSTGLKMAGFNCVYANDVCINSVNTIRANHKETMATCEPIEFLTEDKIRKYIGDRVIHLVAGGPPCQGFSTIGKGDPSDKKNSLFQHFVRIVGILRPKFVLFENVTGLVAKKNEMVLQSIIKSFEDIGFNLNIKVLESQHYGVPQKRKRTLIVGFQKGLSFTFPRPEFDTEFEGLIVPAKTLGGALLELKNYHEGLKDEDPLDNIEDAFLKKELDRERLMCIPEGGCIRYKADEDKYLPEHLKLKIDWNKTKEGRLRENQYHRLSMSRPAPTINTENHHYYHPREHRKFTLRELATLQSFPLNYQFMGRNVAIKRQIGNAVPPLMGKAIGLQILHSLDSKNINDDLSRIDVRTLRSAAFTYDDREALNEYHKKRKISVEAKQAITK